MPITATNCRSSVAATAAREYVPAASGNQWTTGAVACPRFTGVRLRDVLEACGIAEDAVYIGYYGADTHVSGDPSRSPISVGFPCPRRWRMNPSSPGR